MDVPQSSSGDGIASSDCAASAAFAAAGSGGKSSSSSKDAMVSIPQGHGDLCDIPAAHVFPLGVMKFRGVPVAVPGDVPAALRFRYGDTYMIPRCVFGMCMCGVTALSISECVCVCVRRC